MARIFPRASFGGLELEAIGEIGDGQRRGGAQLPSRLVFVGKDLHHLATIAHIKHNQPARFGAGDTHFDHVAKPYMIARQDFDFYANLVILGDDVAHVWSGWRLA